MPSNFFKSLNKNKNLRKILLTKWNFKSVTSQAETLPPHIAQSQSCDITR